MDDFFQIELLRFIIEDWAKSNKRDYPWRQSENPYVILTTEIMLQRTRADKVAEIYPRFFEQYPDVFSLAKADSSRLSDIIRPLGLNKRWEKFINMAQIVCSNFGGEIPKDREKLISINGIGQYIAGMVMMCAFHKESWAIDTNIARIINRVIGLDLSPSDFCNKEMMIYSQYFFGTKDVRDTCYSILDFAACICKSPHPKCSVCPVRMYGICRLSDKSSLLN